MNKAIAFSLSACVSAAISFSAASNAVPASASAAQAAQAVNSDVIVILRDQLAGVPPARRAMGARAAAVATAQSPVVAQLQQVRARAVRSFSTINAFATRVSAAEAAQLAGHPLVQAVVPDRIIHALGHGQSASRDQSALGTATAAVSAAAAPLTTTVPGDCAAPWSRKRCNSRTRHF